jgi:glycerophosphoryl diester phosphodiesterase
MFERNRISATSPRPRTRFRRIAGGIVVTSLATVMTLKNTDFASTVRRDVIRNTVGMAPAQFYSPFDGEVAASGGMLTIAHNAGDRRDTAETAIEHGADVVEVDVVSIGGVLYAAHDQPNQRVGSVTFRGPTLDSIWDLVDGKARIELDLKDSSRSYLRLVIHFLKDRGGGANVIISSRSPTALANLREMLPDATLVYSVNNIISLQFLLQNDALLETVDGVSIRASLLNEESMDELKSHDLLVLAWTVNDFATAEYLLELGVDGVATDNLAILEYYSEAPAE